MGNPIQGCKYWLERVLHCNQQLQGDIRSKTKSKPNHAERSQRPKPENQSMNHFGSRDISNRVFLCAILFHADNTLSQPLLQLSNMPLPNKHIDKRNSKPTLTKLLPTTHTRTHTHCIYRGEKERRKRHENRPGARELGRKRIHSPTGPLTPSVRNWAKSSERVAGEN